MSERSELILALILPLVAFVWTAADATSGVVSAARLQSAPIAIAQLAEAVSGPATAAPADERTGNDVCADAHTGGAQRQPLNLLHPALQQLCQAGLRFTERLSRG